MPDEVEEEVPLRHRDYLVCYLHEEGETLGTLQVQSVGNGGAEILGPSRGVYFESLVCVVREVDL